MDPKDIDRVMNRGQGYAVPREVYDPTDLDALAAATGGAYRKEIEGSPISIEGRPNTPIFTEVSQSVGDAVSDDLADLMGAVVEAQLAQQGSSVSAFVDAVRRMRAENPATVSVPEDAVRSMADLKVNARIDGGRDGMFKMAGQVPTDEFERLWTADERREHASAAFEEVDAVVLRVRRRIARSLVLASSSYIDNADNATLDKMIRAYLIQTRAPVKPEVNPFDLMSRDEVNLYTRDERAFILDPTGGSVESRIAEARWALLVQCYDWLPSKATALDRSKPLDLGDALGGRSWEVRSVGPGRKKSSLPGFSLEKMAIEAEMGILPLEDVDQVLMARDRAIYFRKTRVVGVVKIPLLRQVSNPYLAPLSSATNDMFQSPIDASVDIRQFNRQLAGAVGLPEAIAPTLPSVGAWQAAGRPGVQPDATIEWLFYTEEERQAVRNATAATREDAVARATARVARNLGISIGSGQDIETLLIQRIAPMVPASVALTLPLPRLPVVADALRRAYVETAFPRLRSYGWDRLPREVVDGIVSQVIERLVNPLDLAYLRGTGAESDEETAQIIEGMRQRVGTQKRLVIVVPNGLDFTPWNFLEWILYTEAEREAARGLNPELSPEFAVFSARKRIATELRLPTSEVGVIDRALRAAVEAVNPTLDLSFPSVDVETAVKRAAVTLMYPVVTAAWVGGLTPRALDVFLTLSSRMPSGSEALTYLRQGLGAPAATPARTNDAILSVMRVLQGDLAASLAPAQPQPEAEVVSTAMFAVDVAELRALEDVATSLFELEADSDLSAEQLQTRQRAVQSMRDIAGSRRNASSYADTIFQVETTIARLKDIEKRNLPRVRERRRIREDRILAEKLIGRRAVVAGAPYDIPDARITDVVVADNRGYQLIKVSGGSSVQSITLTAGSRLTVVAGQWTEIGVADTLAVPTADIVFVEVRAPRVEEDESIEVKRTRVLVSSGGD